ncbi:hypothetical protein FQR65_LT15329 [Abscondita terminalis]|nr:hypothetical protein FQR65_LT15329 [Abscondita terminalis]
MVIPWWCRINHSFGSRKTNQIYFYRRENGGAGYLLSGKMADRILGMGDVVSLVERAQEQFDEEEAKKLHKKIAKNEFGMLPGVGKAIKDVDINDDAFKHIDSNIQSMTPEERRKPSTINMSRKQRIAKGAGRKLEDVNALMKQFEQMGKMMKMMQGPQGKQLMAMMGKGMPGMGGGMPGFGR